MTKITKMVAIREVVATWESNDRVHISTSDGAVWMVVNEKLKINNIMQSEEKWVAAQEISSP